MILLPKSKPSKIKICSDIFNACLEHNSAYRYNTLILLFYYISLFSIDIFQVHWLSFWADVRDWPARDTCWGPDCPCLPWHPSDTPLTVPVGSPSSHQQVSQARSNINQIYSAPSIYRQHLFRADFGIKARVAIYRGIGISWAFEL